MRKRLISSIISLALVMTFNMPVLAAGQYKAATWILEEDLEKVSESSSNATFNIKQTKGGCVLSSTAMMLRQKAINDRNDNWSSITESTVKKKGANANGAQYFSFTYKDNNRGLNMSVKSETLYSMTKNNGKRNKNTQNVINRLKKELNKHPEGIVLYVYRFGNNPNRAHAVYLKSYSGGSFYCVDPVNGKEYNLANCSLSGKNYANSKNINDILSYTVSIWYVASSKNKVTQTANIVTTPEQKPEATPSNKLVKTLYLSKSIYTYTGANIKPEVIAKTADGNLVNSSNYTLDYSNINGPGIYAVVVRFKNNYVYEGDSKLFLTVNPMTVSLRSLTANKDGTLTVTYTTPNIKVGGYEIQYSQYSDFAYSTSKYVNSQNQTSYTITGLGRNSKYYVRVRTYCQINSIGVFSEWSNSAGAFTAAVSQSNQAQSNQTQSYVSEKLTFEAVASKFKLNGKALIDYGYDDLESEVRKSPFDANGLIIGGGGIFTCYRYFDSYLTGETVAKSEIKYYDRYPDNMNWEIKTGEGGKIQADYRYNKSSKTVVYSKPINAGYNETASSLTVTGVLKPSLEQTMNAIQSGLEDRINYGTYRAAAGEPNISVATSGYGNKQTYDFKYSDGRIISFTREGNVMSVKFYIP